MVGGVVDGEVLLGGAKGNDEGGSFCNAEGVVKGVCLKGEVAGEGGVGAGDDDDVFLKFFEEVAEGLVKGGGLFSGEGMGVGEKEENGWGFVNRISDCGGVKVGDDGDVEDGLGAGGGVIEDDDGFF